MTFAHELANQSDTKTEAGIQNPSRAQNRYVCVCVVTKGKNSISMLVLLPSAAPLLKMLKTLNIFLPVNIFHVPDLS